MYTLRACSHLQYCKYGAHTAELVGVTNQGCRHRGEVRLKCLLCKAHRRLGKVVVSLWSIGDVRKAYLGSYSRVTSIAKM